MLETRPKSSEKIDLCQLETRFNAWLNDFYEGKNQKNNLMLSGWETVLAQLLPNGQQVLADILQRGQYPDNFEEAFLKLGLRLADFLADKIKNTVAWNFEQTRQFYLKIRDFLFDTDYFTSQLSLKNLFNLFGQFNHLTGTFHGIGDKLIFEINDRLKFMREEEAEQILTSYFDHDFSEAEILELISTLNCLGGNALGCGENEVFRKIFKIFEKIEAKSESLFFQKIYEIGSLRLKVMAHKFGVATIPAEELHRFEKLTAIWQDKVLDPQQLAELLGSIPSMCQLNARAFGKYIAPDWVGIFDAYGKLQQIYFVRDSKQVLNREQIVTSLQFNPFGWPEKKLMLILENLYSGFLAVYLAEQGLDISQIPLQSTPYLLDFITKNSGEAWNKLLPILQSDFPYQKELFSTFLAYSENSEWADRLLQIATEWSDFDEDEREIVIQSLQKFQECLTASTETAEAISAYLDETVALNFGDLARKILQDGVAILQEMWTGLTRKTSAENQKFLTKLQYLQKEIVLFGRIFRSFAEQQRQNGLIDWTLLQAEAGLELKSETFADIQNDPIKKQAMLDLYQQNYPGRADLFANLRDQFEKYLAPAYDARFYILYQNKQIIGFVRSTAWEVPGLGFQKEMRYLGALNVWPPYQKYCLGSSLFESFLQNEFLKGGQYLIGDVDPEGYQHGYYRTLGFEDLERSDDFFDGEPTMRIRLTQELFQKALQARIQKLQRKANLHSAKVPQRANVRLAQLVGV